jgi:UDP-GlcNAc:undecaprenyl-phosphate GlcNAc-1-phosphate transferase
VAFGLIALFMVMTLKFTRRKKGFRTTPLDFIILFISLGLPVLVGLEIDGLNLMTLSVHIIVMLFAYEVVMGELRGKNRFINRATVTMFILLFVRSTGIIF